MVVLNSGCRVGEGVLLRLGSSGLLEVEFSLKIH